MGLSTREYLTFSVALFFVLLFILVLLRSFFKRRQNFEVSWKELQQLLKSKSTWKEAVVKADALVDDALKQAHFRGKTMGERLVAAQHHLTSNDMIWFSHKLRNKIVYDGIEVTKTDVKEALLGFWQALKDLGAFHKDDDED